MNGRNADAIRCLVAAGADVNAYVSRLPEPPFRRLGFDDERDYTPAQLAGRIVQDVDILKLLLDLGADVNFIYPTHRKFV